MKQQRLDEILIERGWVEDRNDAFVIVTEGRVRVNGHKAVSPAQMVRPIDNVEIRAEREFVGRGALKLEAALNAFKISVDGIVAADVGSAIGGFVEVLLKRGAAKVFAIDTARGKLDMKLREDPRVEVMEGVNVLGISQLPLEVRLVTIDVSLVSLRLILPMVKKWITDNGSIVALLKPQYEAEPADLRRGIVKDDATRERIVSEFRAWLREHEWEEQGMIESPIRGSEGNVEYLFWLAPRNN